MRNVILFLAVIAFGCQQPKLVNYVDPFIGTAAQGHTFPRSSMPFGTFTIKFFDD